MNSPTQHDEHWMRLALEQARQAGDNGEVPVGAVIVAADVEAGIEVKAGTGSGAKAKVEAGIKEGQLLAAARNRSITDNDPTAHAEIVALRQAAQTLGNYRLPGTTLYVTIEPCTMCIGAMIHARIERLVFGALEPRAGAVISQHQLLHADCYNHRPQFHHGVLEQDCASLMQQFFSRKRGRADKKTNQFPADSCRMQSEPTHKRKSD